MRQVLPTASLSPTVSSTRPATRTSLPRERTGSTAAARRAHASRKVPQRAASSGVVEPLIRSSEARGQAMPARLQRGIEYALLGLEAEAAGEQGRVRRELAD